MQRGPRDGPALGLSRRRRAGGRLPPRAPAGLECGPSCFPGPPGASIPTAYAAALPRDLRRRARPVRRRAADLGALQRSPDPALVHRSGQSGRRPQRRALERRRQLAERAEGRRHRGVGRRGDDTRRSMGRHRAPDLPAPGRNLRHRRRDALPGPCDAHDRAEGRGRPEDRHPRPRSRGLPVQRAARQRHRRARGDGRRHRQPQPCDVFDLPAEPAAVGIRRVDDPHQQRHRDRRGQERHLEDRQHPRAVAAGGVVPDRQSPPQRRAVADDRPRRPQRRRLQTARGCPSAA
jgi:hypothetical protein